MISLSILRHLLLLPCRPLDLLHRTSPTASSSSWPRAVVEQLILDHLGHDAVQHLGRDFAGVLEERGNNIESTEAPDHIGLGILIEILTILVNQLIGENQTAN